MDFDLADNDFFSASPILAQFLAAVVAMLGVGLTGIIEVCNILITPTIYLLLNVFMLTLGGDNNIFSLVACGPVIARQKTEK